MVDLTSKTIEKLAFQAVKSETIIGVDLPRHTPQALKSCPRVSGHDLFSMLGIDYLS